MSSVGGTVAGCLVVTVFAYLVGSIPVAVLIGRRQGVDPRDVGDRNPGYWNSRDALGRSASIVVFVGDVLKGVVAAGVARVAGGPWWLGYVAGAAAMVGHAWPVFAGFRGGRSILTFAGALTVLAPVPAAIAIGVCVLLSLLTRRFAIGARVGVFGFPIVQAFFDPRARVAATGALMSIIGLRFAQAARTSGRATSAPDEPSPGAVGPS